MSQQVSIFPPDGDQKGAICLKTEDSNYVHWYTEDQLPEFVTFNDQYILSPQYWMQGRSFDRGSVMIETLDSIEPGTLPEADLPYKIQYTSDGQRLIVMYHHSNNVCVYNTENNDLLADIPVGLGPEDMFLTESYIYVCCYFSSTVYVIDLNDYSATSFGVDPQPCVIKVNSNESIAYLGFFTGYHSEGGYLAAYDLVSHEQIFSNTWSFIDQIRMWEGFTGRFVYTHSGFYLINNDQYVACLKQGGRNLIFLDAQNGNIVKEFDPIFVMKPTESTDSIYVASILSGNSGMRFLCINTSTFEVVDSVLVSSSYTPASWYWQDNLALDGTESKLFIEMTGMPFEHLGYLADFGDHTCVEFHHDYTDARYYCDVSYDGRYVIMPFNYLGIFDFETETYATHQYIGNPWIYCKVLDASPNTYEMAWHNHVSSELSTNYMKGEIIAFIDFSNPTSFFFSDSILCGEQPEADKTYSAVLNTKHNKIITANPLSGNISIIDALTYEVDTIIPITRITTVNNATDDLVVLSGFDNPKVTLFDLNSLSVVDRFDIGNNPYDAWVMVSPLQDYFYTYNRNNQMLYKFKLENNSAAKVDSLLTGDTFVHFLDWDYRYYPEISPDGMYIFMQDNGDFKIIHTGRMDIECIVASTLHIFDMDFSDDNKRVCIAHGGAKNYFTIVYLDGPNSYSEHVVYVDDGGYGVAYNPLDQKFYCAGSSNIYIVDPETGNIDDVIYTSAQNYIMQMDIDPDGLVILMTMTHLYYNDQEYYLREFTRRFTIDQNKQYCIIPSPGPDRVYVLDFLSTNLYEVPISPSKDEVQIYPNPADQHINITSKVNIAQAVIFDGGGKLLQTFHPQGKQFELNTSALKSGIYIIEITTANSVTKRKFVVK